MRGVVIAIAMAAMLPIAAKADELTDMKAALESATKSIQALQKRVQALEAEKAQVAAESKVPRKMKSAATPVVKAPPPEPAALAAPVVAPELKPVNFVPDVNKARLEIHGAVQLDAIYDFNKVNPNWEGTLRPSQIPVECPPVGTDPGCGKNGVTNFNVRATNLDIKGFLPTDMGEVKTELAFDLWGGADEGQVRFRLTQAWGSFGPYLFGYTDSLFMDIDVFPNIIDFWGPSGMMFLRDPQIRWTPYNQSGLKLAVALEVPGAAIDEGKLDNDIAPNLNVVATSRYPDITAQVRADGPWGHVQLAGVARWISFDNPTGIDGNPANTIFGWGGNLTTKIKTFGDDAIKGQIAYGNGIAAYSNDCCLDLAPNVPVTIGGPLPHAEALPLLNWLVYYDHWWSKQWSSSIGFSQNRQTNSAGELDTDQHLGSYASANLLFYPMQNVTVGVEALWGERININGAMGQDQRIQFSTRVKF
jgi:DcaP outer membrane protein